MRFIALVLMSITVGCASTSQEKFSSKKSFDVSPRISKLER